MAAKQDKSREHRITMEIIVDCYAPEEQAMGWYYYLESHLKFPFLATCKEERAISPLDKGTKVHVTSMAPEDECEHEMFVMAEWNDEERELAVPLAQLKPVGKVDAATQQAIADWHYWVKMGYTF